MSSLLPPACPPARQSAVRVEKNLPPLGEFVRYFCVTYTCQVSPCPSNAAPLARFFPACLIGFSLFCVQAIGFYYLHRLFHHPLLYARVHKVHHEWKAPTALAAAYAHPLEEIVVNACPGLVGPLVMGPHVLSFTAYMVFGLTITSFAHSGYSFPFANWLHLDAKYHDYHHKTFNCNYGFWWLDWLNGTLKTPQPEESQKQSSE